MGNAASQLLRLLRAANDNLRGAKENVAMDAGILLHEIKKYLDASESIGVDLDFYRDKLPEISRAFFTLGIGGTLPNTTFSEVEFALQAISAQMGKDFPATSEEDAQSISEIADELLNLVSGDSALPEELRRYCFEVVNSVRTDLVRFRSLGAFDLQESIDRLIAATSYVAASYTNNTGMRDKIKNLWDKLMGLNKVGKDVLALKETGSEIMTALPFTSGG